MSSGFLSHLKPEKNREVLNATCGPIRGNIYKHGEKIVDGYLGIPFAKPPIGDLRFKKPVAAEKWTEPLNCYEYGPGCPQSGSFAKYFSNSQLKFLEDNCLTLNVFAPNWKSDEFENGLPVLVYFYGGGFEVGTSSSTPSYSLTGTIPLKDVIVVTVNYRLGPLGFFTTGDDISSGNYGLWDQTLALQWVQDHIQSFGGDPKNVTISGTSAGGASADLLALSPHSNYLFHRIISMSGTGFCGFAIRPKNDQAKVFKEFAQHHGYSGNDSQNLLEWYQSHPVSKFGEMTGFQKTISGFLHFLPNFDGDFFPKPLDELRREAPKIDVMVTVGEYEGLGISMNNPLVADSMKNFKAVIAEEFGSDVVENTDEVQRKLFEFYSKNEDWTDKATVDKKLIEFIGDAYFNIGALDTVKSFAKHGNNGYLASFDYYNLEKKNPIAKFLPFTASTHGSEYKYIFGSGMMSSFNPTEEERKVMEMMGNFVANFVKYGNPNEKHGTEVWEKYSLDQPERYFKIDYPNSSMKEKFQNGRLGIYDEINRNGKKYQEIVHGISL